MGEGSSAPDGVDLAPDERADIDGMYLRVATSTLYELLGVTPTADRRAIRDGYFALSQRFHPDAFFGRNLGPWKQRLEAVFREITKAYDVLGNRNHRAEYDAAQARTSSSSVPPQRAPTPTPMPPGGPPPSSLTAPTVGPAQALAAQRPASIPPSVGARLAQSGQIPNVKAPTMRPPSDAYEAPRDVVATPPRSAMRPAASLPVVPGGQSVGAPRPPATPLITGVSRPVTPSVPPPPAPSTPVMPTAVSPPRAPAPVRPSAPTTDRMDAPPVRPSSPVMGRPSAPITQRTSTPVMERSAPPTQRTPAPTVERAAPTTQRTASPYGDAVVPPPMRPSTSSNASAVVPPPVGSSPRVGGQTPQRPVTTETTGSYSRVDPEAARRAAREALARKLAGGRMSSAAMPAAPEPMKTAPHASPLDSLEVVRAVRSEAERKARVAQLVRAADEALRSNNLVGASNALAVAATLAPEDASLRARAEDVAQKLAASMVEKYVEQARAEERAGAWDAAAVLWQKASVGRPRDGSLLDRAAAALLRGGTDLRKAAELARRATQLEPSSAKAYITLAQVFTAAGLRTSALTALETASKLDPTSPVVKDLLHKAKG